MSAISSEWALRWARMFSTMRGKSAMLGSVDSRCRREGTRRRGQGSTARPSARAVSTMDFTMAWVLLIHAELRPVMVRFHQSRC